MADHVPFIDNDISQANRIDSAWLNPVNTSVYQGKNAAFVVATGAANAYTVTLPASNLAVLSDGQILVFQANHTNSGASALTVVGSASIGPTAIEASGVPTASGTITSGDVILVIYNNSVWNILATTAGAVISGSVVNLTVTNSLTVEGDSTFEGNVTIEGDLTVDGDSTFLGDVDMSNATSVEYLDSSIDVNDLSTEVINFIISSASQSSSSAVVSGNGRVSLASGVRVMAQDYLAKTASFYVGSSFQESDGAGNFSPFLIAELTQTLASTTFSPAASVASSAYDMHLWVQTLSVSGINLSGSTATATTATHNLTTGGKVFIIGADQSEYNGYHTVTGTGGGGTTFTFAVTGTPATPATGTITVETGRYSRGKVWRNSGQPVTGATNATPIVITSVAHGLSSGDIAVIENVVGNTAANGSNIATVLTADTYSIPVAGNGVYVTGSGTMASRGAGAEIEASGSSYVNTSAVTNGPGVRLGTIVATVLTNAANELEWKLGSAAAGGGAAWLSVDNISNEDLTKPVTLDSTASWTYNSNTARKLNNSATNRCTFVRCLPSKTVSFQAYTRTDTQSGNATLILIGFYSDAVQAPNSIAGSAAPGSNALMGIPLQSVVQGKTGIGRNYAQGLECIGGTIITPSTYYGSSASFTAVPLYTTAILGQLFM